MPVTKSRRLPVRKRTASPKRKRTASPKRKRTASPKRKRTASHKRKRTASHKRKRTASHKRKRTASPHASRTKRSDGLIRLHIAYLGQRERNFDVALKSCSHVSALRELVATHGGMDLHSFRLVYRGRPMEDDRELRSFKLESLPTIHVIKRFANPFNSVV